MVKADRDALTGTGLIGPGKQPPSRAFTRVELLAIVFVVLSLSAVLLGVRITAAQNEARKVQCMDNLARIMVALSLYTQDNHDFFPPNPDDGNTLPGYSWCPGYAGRGDPDEFNSDILANGRLCLVAPYLRSNVSVFHCTMDSRKGPYGGTNPALRRVAVPSARTVSMNAAVGTVDDSGHSGKPTLPVNAPWLDNRHSHRRNSPWRTYGKTPDIVAPTPGNLFVLIEEEPSSLDDACFGFGMNSPAWINWPGTLHDAAGVLAFADGHSEAHRWVDPRTILHSHWNVKIFPPAVRLVPPAAGVMSVPNSADWLWLSQHTSAKAN